MQLQYKLILLGRYSCVHLVFIVPYGWKPYQNPTPGGQWLSSILLAPLSQFTILRNIYLLPSSLFQLCLSKNYYYLFCWSCLHTSCSLVYLCHTWGGSFWSFPWPLVEWHHFYVMYMSPTTQRLVHHICFSIWKILKYLQDATTSIISRLSMFSIRLPTSQVGTIEQSYSSFYYNPD